MNNILEVKNLSKKYKDFSKKYNINTIDKITLEELMLLMIKVVR